jgi:hypothetical protein
MNTSPKTYLICGCGTITVDVDVLGLSREARRRFFTVIDILEDMAGIGDAQAAGKRIAEILSIPAPVVAPKRRGRPPKPKPEKTFLPTESRRRPCRYCGREFSIMGVGTHEKACGNHTWPSTPDPDLNISSEDLNSAAPNASEVAQPATDLTVVTDIADIADIADDSSLECQHCAKTFRTVDGRLRHERGCEGTLDAATMGPRRTPTCEDCGRTFVSTGGLVQHQQKCTGPTVPAFGSTTGVLRCDDCDTEFELGPNGGVRKLIVHTLLMHQREIHHDERQTESEGVVRPRWLPRGVNRGDGRRLNRAVVRCPACRRYLPGTPCPERDGWIVRRHDGCTVTKVADRWLVLTP